MIPTTPGLDPSPPPVVAAFEPSDPYALVELLDWPAQAERRSELAAAGRPRLLLVAPDAPPPSCVDPHEDWVRLPGDPGDIEARRTLLAQRSHPVGSQPVLDEDGVLRHGRHLAILPPIEARLAECLLRRAGRVVPRTALLEAGWPGRHVDDTTLDGRALDGRIKLLRRRLAPLGIEIHTVRGVGFLLQA